MWHLPILAHGLELLRCTLLSMRLTDFWQRMDQALGAGYAESWANDFVIESLGGRTVRQALASGMDPKVIWRAVHAELGLPPSTR